MSATNQSQRTEEQQPVRYYQYPKDVPAEGDANRFDKLRNAPPAAAPSANNDAKQGNIIEYDPNPPARTPESLPPPHHDLKAMSNEDRATWLKANNPSSDEALKDQSLKKDNSLATTNSGSSKSSSGLKKQDSATSIGGMKTNDYLQNISADGSGVVASMHLNPRSSPKSAKNTPPILIQKNNSPSQQKSSEFANLKPQRDGVDHAGLGVVTDSSEVKNSEGQAKTREWTYDATNEKQLDPQAVNSEAIPNANADDNSHISHDKASSNNLDPQAEHTAAIPKASAAAGDANIAQSNQSSMNGKELDPQAGNAAAIPKANAGDANLKEEHSLLRANKSGEHRHVTPLDGGVRNPNSSGNIEKQSVWQKITCSSGSKTKQGKANSGSKHYVNPAHVVNNNQGLK